MDAIQDRKEIQWSAPSNNFLRQISCKYRADVWRRQSCISAAVSAAIVQTLFQMKRFASELIGHQLKAWPKQAGEKNSKWRSQGNRITQATPSLIQRTCQRTCHCGKQTQLSRRRLDNRCAKSLRSDQSTSRDVLTPSHHSHNTFEPTL